MSLVIKILLLGLLSIGQVAASTINCQFEKDNNVKTILGTVINEEGLPVIGVSVGISLPQQNMIELSTDENGCFMTTIETNKSRVPLSLDIKRKSDSAVLVRAVDRCQFSTNPHCQLKAVKVIRPNTVYMLPFEGETNNQPFMSKQFRTALAKRFVYNLQELEGENVVRRLKRKSERGKFHKLKAPSLKLFNANTTNKIEVSDFEKLEKLGADLNALALISGSTSLDEVSNKLDMSSFYLVPDEETWSLDDHLDVNRLNNVIATSKKLSPKWTYYTMMALAKREFSEALSSPDRTAKLHRIKAYLQAQRNQLDSRSQKGFKQHELVDLLCEVRQELNERCGKIMLSME